MRRSMEDLSIVLVIVKGKYIIQLKSLLSKSIAFDRVFCWFNTMPIFFFFSCYSAVILQYQYHRPSFHPPIRLFKEDMVTGTLLTSLRHMVRQNFDIEINDSSKFKNLSKFFNIQRFI